MCRDKIKPGQVEEALELASEFVGRPGLMQALQVSRLAGKLVVVSCARPLERRVLQATTIGLVAQH